MPELPEVETIVRRIGPAVTGCTVTGVWNDWPRHVAPLTVAAFTEQIVGQQVVHVGRRGKFIHIRLSADHLLIHLRMSGDLEVLPQSAPPTRFAHTVLQFDDATELRFSDARKFGQVRLVADPQTVTGKLGPEPLDANFSAAEFHQRLQQTKRQIKPLLLDQRFLAGVGNIYANDGLYLAQIHPLRRSDSLTADESARLLDNLRLVLQEGIDNHGASIDWVYRGGNQQHNFKVHERKGEPCLRCGTPIEKIVVGQRGTYLCPVCQPAPNGARGAEN